MTQYRQVGLHGAEGHTPCPKWEAALQLIAPWATSPMVPNPMTFQEI